VKVFGLGRQRERSVCNRFTALDAIKKLLATFSFFKSSLAQKSVKINTHASRHAPQTPTASEQSKGYEKKDAQQANQRTKSHESHGRLAPNSIVPTGQSCKIVMPKFGAAFRMRSISMMVGGSGFEPGGSREPPAAKKSSKPLGVHNRR